MKKGALPTVARSFDVIVVGSGVAGLRAAIEAAESGLDVVLLAKDTATDSNTEKAQGGVAVALSDEDEVGLHYSDTLEAGAGLCDHSAVQTMVCEGPGLISQLIEWGARFDREGSRLALTREGAHSARRVLHAHGDSTGREILRALWSRARVLEKITFHPHTYTIDLILDRGRVTGLWVLDEADGGIVSLMSGAVILACGGAGQVFRETTNPLPATGDGIAIAWRAGARLRDMEFVQFHPTALHVPGAPRFLLSEALRGEGGLLVSTDGRHFMKDVDPRAELAPRDTVSRAIIEDIRRTGSDHVLLDMTGCEAGFVRKRFPRIHRTCLTYGVDIEREPVPVSPAAHYLMGGVSTDMWGRTSIPGLYAAGEAACTGVHGANRLASNSLLEGIVFGARAGGCVVKELQETSTPGDPPPLPDQDPSSVAGLVEMLRSIAWNNAGIVRDAAGLNDAVVRLEEIDSRLPRRPGVSASSRARRGALEASNMVTVARLIARCALTREESRGAHFRSDYPSSDDTRFGVSSFIRNDGAGVTFEPGAVTGSVD